MSVLGVTPVLFAETVAVCFMKTSACSGPRGTDTISTPTGGGEEANHS